MRCTWREPKPRA
ncbi:hypothetical protein YPPY07_4890, partial [Yersinia pestis PY-07]